MRPVIRFLFPNLPDGHPAGQYIATNMIAKYAGTRLGGNPGGIEAMEELGKLEDERRGGLAGERTGKKIAEYPGAEKVIGRETPDKRSQKKNCTDGSARPGPPATRCVHF